MITPAKTASAQIADLVTLRQAEHDETNMQSWAAVRGNPANAALFARYAAELTGPTPPLGDALTQAGAKTVGQIGKALPDPGKKR
jgi:hypothetical protein